MAEGIRVAHAAVPAPDQRFSSTGTPNGIRTVGAIIVCDAIMSGSFGKFRTSTFPSLHHGKEGWLRHSKNCRVATSADAAGVVLLFPLKSENHPVLAISGC